MKTFATVCSGIGAPEVAASRLGWKCLFSSEIEPFPNAVREHHFPGVPNYGDMTKYHEWPVSRPDVLAAGTPCQAFSIAGLRKGMADPRGNLTLTFLGIIERYAPRWVLWENVPGVHSSWSDAENGRETEASREIGFRAERLAREAGFDAETAGCFRGFIEVNQTNDFDSFIAALEELGYGVATAIYDAQYFGLAQRRERVFVVAHSGGQWQRAAAVLFERESLCGNPPPRRETGEKATHDVAPCLGASGRGFERTGDWRGQDAVIPEVSPCITRNYGKQPDSSDTNNGPMVIPVGIGGSELGYALRAEASHSGDKGDGGVNTNLVCETVHSLRADGFDASEDGTGRGTPLVSVESKKWPKETADCLTAAFAEKQGLEDQHVNSGCGLFVSDCGVMAVRRLTPTECEFLQGFPRNFTNILYKGKPPDDGPRYRALGNSMAVPVIEWIFRRMDLVDELVPIEK